MPSAFDAYKHIHNFRHRNQIIALGAATLFLSEAEPFSSSKFGQWVDTLRGQIVRNHYFFSQVDGRIVGYCGWALTSHETARDWIDNKRMITFEECRDGPCLLVMAVRASEKGIHPYQVMVMRSLHGDREVTYWKRINPKGVRVVAFNLRAPGVRRPLSDIRIELIG